MRPTGNIAFEPHTLSDHYPINSDIDRLSVYLNAECAPSFAAVAASI
jgi:hypothetical protein